METKAKCILAMVAMCILITPAFSQGGERDGRNGNQGSNMGPGQDNAMMSGGNGAPFGQGNGFEQGQAPDADAPRFEGCKTRPQKMSTKGPIKPPSETPGGLGNEFGTQGVLHNEATPWSNLEQNDGPNDGAAFGFTGPDKHAPPRSIMAQNHPKTHTKKSLMEKKHEKTHKKKPKRTLRHLPKDEFPGMPPMKSIMDHGR
jgi:hypothetical protein